MMYHVKIDEKKEQILICRKDDTVFHIIMGVDVSKIKKSILKKEYDKKSILDLIKKLKNSDKFKNRCYNISVMKKERRNGRETKRLASF